MSHLVDLQRSITEQLTTIDHASKELDWSWWRVRRAVLAGKLDAVTLPTGSMAVGKASVERLKTELEVEAQAGGEE